MRNHSIRLGVLLPPGNVTIERELRAFTPPDVGLHFNRLSRPVSISTKASLLSMLDSLDRAALDLSQCHPHLIVFGCTTGSLLGGVHDDKKISRRILDLTGAPGLTTTEAVLEELGRCRNRTGSTRLFLLAPYPDDICREEVAFLEGQGFEVRAWSTFGCMHTDQTLAITSEQVADRLRSHRAQIDGCDGIFISCTNLLTMDQVPILEHEFGIPVVTSNQATLSGALRRLQAKHPVGATDDASQSMILFN